MSQPIPIITCGRQAVISRAVKKHFEPEYEVIHAILSPESGAIELPLLLSGQELPASDNVGTQNYSQKPVAVVLGGGYAEADFTMLRAACQGVSEVAWLRMDMHSAVEMPPVGPGYGEAVVDRVKASLGKLAAEGKLEGDGVYFY